MAEAEKSLNDLGKCCGLFTCPWNKGKSVQDKKAFNASEDGAIGGNVARVLDDRNGVGTSGGYITR